MTAAIFKDWFHNSFVPQVILFMKNQGLPVKALLLLDNAPSHPPVSELTTNDHSITLSMPPNVTPLIQPMDQNVIRLTKLYYRTSLLSSVVVQQAGIPESLKKLPLRDSISFLKSAWDRLEKDTIAKYWANILIFEGNENYPEDDIPLSVLKEKLYPEINLEVENGIQLLDVLNPEVNCTAEDLWMSYGWNEDKEDQSNVSQETNIKSDDDEENDYEGGLQKKKIKPNEAISMLNKALEWAQDEMVSQNVVSALMRLRD